jgi:ubiquinol-cytochrome c reductase cytochrome b subunit
MSTSVAASKKTLRYVDDRLGSAGFLRRAMNKVFPDHWSFMIGEIALYSFVLLLLTGVYLTLFFHASSSEVVYNGRYAPLRGVAMTDAYKSTLDLSFDVRGGLLVRQIHHWAALIFLASIVLHLCRVFFTGAFRKPRTINWHIGVGLLTLSLLEGFAGYSLPDDLLSGTGIRIAYSVLESIPVVGTYAAYLVFGGDYPGVDFIPRLFIIHVLLIPGILVALVSAHMMILWHQKHTDFPGEGKSERTVVGTPFFPTFLIKTNGFLFLVFGSIALLAAFTQINPIWLYGPYDPAQVSAGSQPDWYLMFLDGGLRMWPNWETDVLGHTVSWNLFLPGIVLPGVMFTLLALYPAIEARMTGDRGSHDVLQRPRDVPTRTALGITALVFYLVLVIDSANDILARTFDWSLQATAWSMRVLVLLAPPVAYWVTKRWCLGLQRHDRELLEHGVETGIIRRLPSGEYVEVTAPLPRARQEVLAGQLGVPTPALERVANGHPEPPGLIARAKTAVGGFFYDEEPEP